MYATDNNDKIVGSSPPHAPMALVAGGYWQEPTGIRVGLTVQQVEQIYYRCMSNSPLFKYVSAFQLHHCPGDTRNKNKRVGQRGYAFGSYSKTDGMSGTEWAEQKAYRVISSVDSPSQAAIFVEEADSRGVNLGTWVIDAFLSPSGGSARWV